MLLARGIPIIFISFFWLFVSDDSDLTLTVTFEYVIIRHDDELIIEIRWTHLKHAAQCPILNKIFLPYPT